jgi:hypothetical protein
MLLAWAIEITMHFSRPFSPAFRPTEIAGQGRLLVSLSKQWLGQQTPAIAFFL